MISSRPQKAGELWPPLRMVFIWPIRMFFRNGSRHRAHSRGLPLERTRNNLRSPYPRTSESWQWGFGITVHELVAADARAAVTLWRHLASHVAQVDTVTVLAVPLDVLMLLLPEQVVEFVAANHWMTRIVDAAGAIAARGYPPGVRAEVHLQIADRVAPWNDGRYVLRVEGCEGKLTPGGTGDVHLSVND